MSPGDNAAHPSAPAVKSGCSKDLSLGSGDASPAADAEWERGAEKKLEETWQPVQRLLQASRTGGGHVRGVSENGNGAA